MSRLPHPSRHSVFNADTITVLIGDEHCPESMPPLPNGSCACVIRLSKITVEQLNYYVFGTLNSFQGNWENLKRFGVAELLLKIWDMGKIVFLGIVSGTEFLDGGPVSYTESAQVCFSQFMGKAQPMEGTFRLLMFPAPLLCRSKHQSRDTAIEPLSSVMADIKLEATHSAMEANTHDITRKVSGILVQRDLTYSVYRETYTPSPVQSQLREVVDYHVKRRVDMTHNSCYPKLSIKVTTDKGRGVRASESRMLADKTPCPGYLTEWSVAFHGNLLRGGTLSLSKDDMTYLQKLRRVTIKYYAHLYNVLSNGELFTRAVHSYYLYLGNMTEGEFLCVNLDKHDRVQQFSTEVSMREHWSTCHGIPTTEIMLPMVIPVLVKETPKPKTKSLGQGSKTGNPGSEGPGGARDSGGDAGGAGGSNTGSGKPGSDGPPGGTTDSGGDAGPGSDKGNKGTDKSLEPGDATGSVGVTKARGRMGARARQTVLSRNREEQMSLVSGDVRLKGKPSPRRKVKNRPNKSVTNPGNKPGAKGRPVKALVVKPAESMDDPMDTEVENEVKQALIQTSKQALIQTK